MSDKILSDEEVYRQIEGLYNYKMDTETRETLISDYVKLLGLGTPVKIEMVTHLDEGKGQ